jgi:cell division initiation protein
LKLTPLEIRKQEFKKTLRGFDPIEVTTFLEMVADQFEKENEEKKRLQNRLIELETKLSDYQNTEKMMRETLVNVQEVKIQSEESSRRQADLIIKEAELKSLEIMETARKQARQMREEVGWLKSQKESFINRLRHILLSQVELLSVLEIDDAIPDEMKKVIKSAKNRRQSFLESSEEAEIIEPSPVQDQISSVEQEIIDEEQEGDQEVEVEKIEFGKEENPADKEDSSEETEKVKGEEESEKDLSGEDINEYFKKGIHIDELIKTLNKKGKDK